MANRIGLLALCAFLGVFLLGCTAAPADSSDGGSGNGPTFGSGTAGNGGAHGGAVGIAGGPGLGGNGVLPQGGAGGIATIGGAAGSNNNTAGTTSAGAGGGGPAGPGMSAGCGKVPAEEPRKYLQHDLTVSVAPAYAPKFVNRKYYTYLPADYDPSKAYPLIFYGAGCGASMAETQPAMDVFNNQAILVFLLQVDGCFQAGSSGTADSPDIPYFDAALNEIEANYCVDTNKVFASGYSSGAWLSITLSCSHGDKLRAIAIAAGGQQPVLPACKGQVAALFFVSSGDGSNPIGGATGSGVARDRLLATNGCQMTTTDWDPMWPYCKKYSGCDQNPVVFCDHGGGHSNGRNEKMATEGWWKFFMSLPPE